MKRIDFRDLQKYLHEIPNQFHSDELLKKIHSMDAHTAYALLGGYLAPLLSALTKVTTAPPQPLHLEARVRTNRAEVAHADLKDIKSRWGDKENKLPEIEKLMKQLIEKFKKFINIFPKSETSIDEDGHTDLSGYGGVIDVYEDIDSLTDKIRDLIGDNTVDWQEHPELRRKYSEILTVLTAIIPLHQNRYVLPLVHAKIVLKDLQKALKEIYESRSELEQRALKDLQDRLDKLTKEKNKEIGGLEDKITTLEDRETSNKNRIANLEKQIRDLESGKTKDAGDLLKKDQEINRLKREVSDLKTKDEANKTTISQLREQIKQLNKQVTSLNTKKTENETTIANLREQIKNLTKQVKDLSGDKTGNEKKIADLNKQIKDLNKQVTDLTKDKTGNEKTIDDLNKEIEELNKKITTLEGKKDENTATITKLQEDITRLEREKSEKDIEIQSLKDQLQEAKNELTTVTAAKDAAIEALEKQIEQKDEQIGNLQEEINGLQQKIKDQKKLDERIDQLLKEKEELEKTKGGEIAELQDQIVELDKRLRELEALKDAQIKDLKKDLEKVREDLRIKEKEIKDGKIDEMGKELPDLQKVLKELEDGGIDLKDLSKLRDKLDDLNRLTKDGKDAVNDLGELQKNINELREELKKQKEIELQRKEKEKEVRERENKLDDLQRKILGLREELKNLESLKGKDLTNLREKLEKLEKLKREVGGSNDKVKELEEEVNKLRRELNKDKQEELDRQKEISDREKEIERKKKEEEINKLKEIELEKLKEKQGMMDAYVFMIVVFLTQLHTRQAEKLKAHGETLKKISQIFDQWNVIQRDLNKMSGNARTILQWIKDRKVDSNYNLYTDSSLSKKETDPSKLAIWNTFKSFLPNLQKQVKELRKILDQIRPELPDSAKTLLDTIYKLSGKLLDIPDAQGDNDLTSYLKVVTQSDGEKRVSKEIEDLKTANKNLVKDADKLTDEMSAIRDDIGEGRWNLSDSALKFFWPSYYDKKRQWNAKHNERGKIYEQVDANEKIIQEKERELREEVRQKIALPDKRLTILQWITDSDQTQFKTYMDNLGQGVTALTSVSNMAQQQLQIDTQYYNSLLGLQKGGMDSLTKTIQGILANMRS